MLISKLGEFGLIDRLRKATRLDSSVIKGIGDDCAVLKYDKAKFQLFTCDMLVEGVDFSSRAQPYLIGRKAIAVSISDIAACAGIPHYCLVSLGVPKNTSVEFIDKLYKGMVEIANKYKINICGGDLSRAQKLTIDVSMLGLVEKKNLVLRGGAKKGDIIFVTGRLGGSIYGKHFKFTPRIKEAQFLTKNYKINSMIDISDGLIQDLSQILKESRAGAVIYEELIPQSRAARNLSDALYSGEDFELLFTMPPQEAARLIRKKLKFIHLIGAIVKQGCGLILVDRKNKGETIQAKGFRHF